ncbi:uncharacterized protein BP01DRAFT_43336 [Aspergillus saccharolyticus JOP 1030-1]|uniref:Uncharacterized protein n=1 Tax=Aspergillus saccharolyticus JOP 1030-1 TaxID=1450539 RepID=A0A318ZM55_9EURO|nr:hypothetical protein BP01DRAFT_43336 [Aspergillus saccharolyticus JOP 1030-1]PYH45533.1 hypothetical protein BP01DRAFT_43336 [Aspergillus saccharolyticus JOP 1030-1]
MLQNSTMPSGSIQPKQILKRALSQKEYEFLQEWAPETLKNYEVPSQLKALEPPQAASFDVQDVPSHRPLRLRTSSLYEDCKARATLQGENANEQCSLPIHASAQNNVRLPHPMNAKAATVFVEERNEGQQLQTKVKGSQQTCSKNKTPHAYEFQRRPSSCNSI